VLAKLVSQNTASCWLLIRSTESMQKWFQRNDTRCVIAGSCHEGINLPYVDLNHHATCRHAAITFLRMGHRRIAFLTQVPENAGDKQSELGFMEGVGEFQNRQADGVVLHINDDKRNTGRILRRLMGGNDGPTAILVNRSYHYLTIFSILLQLGKSVPGDISMICRDHDTFLSFLEPAPAYYGDDTQVFAKKILRVVEAIMGSRQGGNLQVNLLPELVAGDSLGPPRQS
jgi:LacI family transcriptional regulator